MKKTLDSVSMKAARSERIVTIFKDVIALFRTMGGRSESLRHNGRRKGMATAMVLLGLVILSMLVGGMYLASYSSHTGAQSRHVDTSAQLKLSETTSRVRSELIRNNENRFASGIGYVRSTTSDGHISALEDDFIIRKDDEEYRIVVEVFDTNKDSIGGGAGAPASIRHPDPAYRERKRFTLDSEGNVAGS